MLLAWALFATYTALAGWCVWSVRNCTAQILRPTVWLLVVPAVGWAVFYGLVGLSFLSATVNVEAAVYAARALHIPTIAAFASVIISSRQLTNQLSIKRGD